MAKNEAKIKFTAETGEFNKAIQSANSEISELRSELKLNEAQMKNTGVTIEALEKQHGLLESQLKASQSKTDALSKKVEKAAEIYGENSNEVTKLKTQLANAQAAEEKIKTSISNCNKELEGQVKAAKEAESAATQLTDKIDKQQSEVDRLKQDYVEATLQYGKNSKEAKELAGQIDKLSGELKDNKKTLSDAEQSAESFDQSLDDVGDSAENLDGKLGNLAVGAAAVGAAMIAAGKEAIDAFNEVDEGADNVIKATGATGDAAAELEQSYKNVASSIVGDFGDIGSALGEVNTRFGFTGAEAEEATTQFVKFSEVTGMDSVSAVQAVSRAIESAGLDTSDYKSILDSLTAAGQTTGVSVDTLATSLTDNGAVMREMGYDTNTTIAMLAQFEKAGVDSNSVVRGMRTALSKWSKDGKDAKTEFSKLVTGIKDGSVDAGTAYEVFGSKAGAELVDAIKSGRFEYEDMIAVIEGSEGSLDNTFEGTIDGGYELELAMQNAKLALAEAGGELGTVLTPALQTFSENILPAATNAIGAMVDGISSAVGWMKEHQGVVIAVASVIGVLATAITAYNVVQGIKTAMEAANVTTVWALVAAHWAQATAAMAALAPYILIVAAIGAVVAAFVILWNKCDGFKNFFINVWETIKNVWSEVKPFFTVLWEGVKVAFEVCKAYLEFAFKVAWENIKLVWSVAVSFFKLVWENIKQVFSVVKTYFVGMFKTAWEGIKLVWSVVTGFFKNIWNTIKGIFSVVKSVLTGDFKGAWEGIKGIVSGWASYFKGIWNQIKNVFSAAKTWFSSTFSAAWSAVKNIWKNCGQFFKDIYGKIKNAFSNVKSIGSDIVSGLWNGISGKVKWISGKIKGFCSDALGAIKNFFGIKSPSRVMRDQVGKMLAEGLAEGIEENTDTVEDSVKEMSQKILDAASERLDTYKTYNNLTLADEVEFWENVSAQCAVGTDARLEADKKYLAAKQSLTDQLVEAEETYRAAIDETYEKIEDRTAAIVESFGLFDRFTFDIGVSKSDLVDNLESQVVALERYQKVIASLESRIGGTALFDALQEMGVQSLGQIEAIASMADAQLAEYIELYNKRTELARETAEKELAAENQRAVQDAYQNYIDTCAELGLTLSDTTESASEDIEIMFTNITTAIKNSMESIASEVTETITAIRSELASTVTATNAVINSIATSGGPSSTEGVRVMPYASAVTSPKILKSATIFGRSNGNLLLGGETSDEMIGGTSTVMAMIQSAVDRSTRAFDIQALAAAVEDLANRPIEMNINGRQFALATAGDSDSVNGLRNTLLSRGLILD